MRTSMNGINASSLESMAAGANNVLGAFMLRKALDENSGAMAQLLAGLPQKDGAGSLIDVQA